MFEVFLTTEGLTSLATLTLLEVILGIDNVIFIAILAAKLPTKEEQDRTRKLGLLGALVSRLALLSVISYIIQLKEPLFYVLDTPFSGKSLILLAGGLFLLFKATKEIHDKIEPEVEDAHDQHKKKKPASITSAVLQIMLLDVVFSIDSVITAVGLTPHIVIMVVANIIALAVMIIASEWISDFVTKHPSVKILALSFLLMIGMVLVGEGASFHIPKGYIYFAMGFSMLVEFFNIRSQSRRKKTGAAA